MKTALLLFLTDAIRVGYERSVYTTDEGQGVVELCAIIYDPPSGGAPRPFFIFASTMDGTAGTCVGHLSDGSTGLGILWLCETLVLCVNV